MNIGKSKVIEKTKICKLDPKIFDKFFSGKNPPEDILVNAKLNESSSLKSIKLYKKIIKIVEDKYINNILMKLELKLL